MNNSTKLAIFALGVSLATAIPTAAVALKFYTQETFTAGKHTITVVEDHRRGTVCYYDYVWDNSHGATAVAVSCLKK